MAIEISKIINIEFYLVLKTNKKATKINQFSLPKSLNFTHPHHFYTKASLILYIKRFCCEV